MKTFKKVLALLLVAALAAGLAVVGTVAYLTHEDEEINVFTVGNVEVELVELQRNDAGTALETFEDGKPLMPIVGSAQGQKDAFGMPTAANYVDKLVYARNIGNSPAYMRIRIAVPTWENTSAAAEDRVKPANNNLHWNLPNATTQEKLSANLGGKVSDSAYVLSGDIGMEGCTITIDGNEYTIYTFTFQDAIAPGYATKAVMSGLYLDSRVDYNPETGLYEDIYHNEFEIPNNTAHIPVIVEAIQADGFNDATEAFSGEKFPANPWANLAIATPENAQKLINNAKPGDTIVLGSGSFDHLVIQNADGTSKTNLTITGEGATVGFIDLNASSNITVENVAFDAAKAQKTYTCKYTPAESGYVANITGSDKVKPAHDIVIKNCTFTGTPADAAIYTPVDFEESGRTSGHAYNITITDCEFACTALNYIRMNYMSEGTIAITNNTFGGNGHSTTHNTMNFTGNSSHLVITGNTINNWSIEKNAIGTSRSGATGVVNITITGNTFSNSALASEGGVIELKASYTASNCNAEISGNTYAGELNYTDETAPIVKP